MRGGVRHVGETGSRRVSFLLRETVTGVTILWRADWGEGSGPLDGLQGCTGSEAHGVVFQVCRTVLQRGCRERSAALATSAGTVRRAMLGHVIVPVQRAAVSNVGSFRLVLARCRKSF